MQWNFDLPQASQNHVNAEFLKGLINVVPARVAGDRPRRFCIWRFDIQMYCSLLQDWQEQYPSLCLRCIFLNPSDQARLNHVDAMSADLCESFKKGLTTNVRYVFMPLFDCVDER